MQRLQRSALRVPNSQPRPPARPTTLPGGQPAPALTTELKALYIKQMAKCFIGAKSFTKLAGL
eukprot:12777226-Alexandrium_andersonii.AAC.2